MNIDPTLTAISMAYLGGKCEAEICTVKSSGYQPCEKEAKRISDWGHLYCEEHASPRDISLNAPRSKVEPLMKRRNDAIS